MAEQGHKTLLVSSDLAHNLGDILETEIGKEPVQLTDTLTALEIDLLHEIRKNWQGAQDFLTQILDYLGFENAVAEEVALIPGLGELFLLTRVLREVESGDYDVIVLDCAPTGGTLRLLTLSDTAAVKLRQIGETKRRMITLLRPVLKRIPTAGHFIPDDEVFGIFDELFRDVGRLGALLKDGQTSSIRLVLNASRISIAESRRAFTYFGLFGFPVDGVFVNKVLPQALADGYLNRWFSLERDLLAAIEESFLNVKRFRVPLLEKEPIGLDALSSMGERIFGECRPADTLSPTRSVTVERVNGLYELSFWLPGLDKQRLDVGRKNDELIVQAGDYTRVFSLPDMLLKQEIRQASYERDRLSIQFDASTS